MLPLKNQENRIIELEKKYNELQKGIDNEFLKTLKEILIVFEIDYCVFFSKIKESEN